MDNTINYKKIFIRFLKEKRLYGMWLRIMHFNKWKNMNKQFFEIVNYTNYISHSINNRQEYKFLLADSESSNWRTEIENIINDFITADFEWRIICYKIDECNLQSLIDFVNSQYFTSWYIGNRELMNKYSYLRKKEEN